MVISYDRFGRQILQEDRNISVELNMTVKRMSNTGNAGIYIKIPYADALDV